MRVLVTGCAGFIGSHVSETLLKRGDVVIGVDNLNDYYNVDVKLDNIRILRQYPNFSFKVEDIRTMKAISDYKPDKIIHLASMAGVRYSLQNPSLYEQVNIGGFIHIMEETRKNDVKHVVYASSSSVYGLNKKVPFSETDPITTCNSPYACSKMAMEIYARTYHQLYNVSNIGLRFFTVYGPRGRPDMAPYKFMKAIMSGDKFKKFGDGSSSRDYTYVDDIVTGIVGALDNEKGVECEIYNLGNSSPVTLNEFITTCEKVTGKTAHYEEVGNQLGDVPHTYADISKAKRDLGYEPQTPLEEGLKKLYESLTSHNA
jgi:UDP-glucuronate 4-epimerase